MITYRLATTEDLDQLACLRWDFKIEESPKSKVMDRDRFIRECSEVLRQNLQCEQWVYWVAASNGEIVSQIFVQKIAKVPKPSRFYDCFGYVTNVYTKPAYRGQGIAASLMEKVQAWAGEQDLEILILWPSERSVKFYERAGFVRSPEALECPLRAD